MYHKNKDYRSNSVDPDLAAHDDAVSCYYVQVVFLFVHVIVTYE